jgi:hypothetical protein
MAVFISPAIECGANGAYDLTMTIKLSSFGERVSWLHARAATEQQAGSRRARLQKASELGAAMLDHPDPAAANAWLRSLLRVTVQRNRVQRGDWI